MKLTFPLLCCLGLGLSGLVQADAKGPLAIDSIRFAEKVDFKKVQTECGLEQRFVSALHSQLRKQGFEPLLPGAASDAQTPRLSIVIEGVWAPGGGAWSGPKRLNISGKLQTQTHSLGNFAGQRSSTGGVFGGFKGTCGILARDVDALSRDIAQWIGSPSKDARLGEL